MPRADDFLLTAEELRLRGLRRKRVLLIAFGSLLLLALAFFSARPAHRAIKGWQARRHAAKAFRFIDEEKWTDARNEAVAAYQLQRNEPAALRAVARFLSRTAQPEALSFWKELAAQEPLDRVDLRDKATAALALGELSIAEAAVNDLLGKEDGGPRSADWLLAAQLAAQQGAAKEAAEYAEKVFAEPSATEHQQLQAIVLQLFTAGNVESAAADRTRTQAWARLTKLAQNKSAAGLQALTILAQRALSRPNEPAGATAPVPPTNELVRALENHPLAKTPEKLLALDLQMHADPGQRESLISHAIETWKESDSDSLAALARWLNSKGQYQRELDTIPLARALQTRDLFLQRLDALGALGQWGEIKRLLETETFPLDAVVERMYLARCNQQLGETTAAKNNWQRALEAGAGDVGKLMSLAEYAEKNGAASVATTAYDAATTAAPRLRAAWQGKLRLALASRDTRRIHAVVAAMLKIWPNETALQNDEAYTRLLLLPNDSGSSELSALEKLGEDLVRREPASLPHRTLLALVRLKQNRPATALSVYEGLNLAPNAVTPSAVAVHAAVLAANQDVETAKRDARQVKPELILPEEFVLIKSLL